GRLLESWWIFLYTKANVDALSGNPPAVRRGRPHRAALPAPSSGRRPLRPAAVLNRGRCGTPPPGRGWGAGPSPRGPPAESGGQPTPPARPRSARAGVNRG